MSLRDKWNRFNWGMNPIEDDPNREASARELGTILTGTVVSRPAEVSCDDPQRYKVVQRMTGTSNPVEISVMVDTWQEDQQN